MTDGAEDYTSLLWAFSGQNHNSTDLCAATDQRGGGESTL